MPEQDQSNFVRNFAIVAGIVTAIFVAVLLLPMLFRDTWEVDNASSVRAKIEEADGVRNSDFMRAHEIYDDILREASGHTIMSERLRLALDDAKTKDDELRPFVQRELDRRSAERQRVDEQRRLAEKRPVPAPRRKSGIMVNGRDLDDIFESNAADLRARQNSPEGKENANRVWHDYYEAGGR
jgi:hypothetical protein